MAKMMKLRVQVRGEKVEIAQIGHAQRSIPYRIKTVTVSADRLRSELEGTAFWEGTGISLKAPV